MCPVRRFLLLSKVFLAVVAGAARSQDVGYAPLPPCPPFSGASRALAWAPDDEWATPCEATRLTATPRYDATVAWLRRLTDESETLRMVSLGKSEEGRDVWMVVASSDGVDTPADVDRAERAVFLAHAGIHPGEIDGKDAGMMLLRDIAVGGKAGLLDHVVFLFIPILGADGHERFGPHSRMNQRGPIEQGWRTNARNLNLNRDFSKLDCAELRALVTAVDAWDPDLWFDIHVTDGADYQYDITWGYNGPHAHSPAAATWMRDVLDPALHGALKEQGHVPGPLVFARDGADMTKGNAAPTFSQRYSHGYGDARQVPTVLVENHSLKPYDQRVLGTYVLLESTLHVLAEHRAALHEAIAADRARRPDPVTLTFKTGEPREVEFLGIGQETAPSPVTGGTRVVWTGVPRTLKIPLFEENVPDLQMARPKAYWVPPAWGDVIERLRLHGLRMDRLDKPRAQPVTMLRVATHELAPEPFEGRMRLKATFDEESHEPTWPPGTVRVPTDQPLGTLAVLLLDPRAPDSFFSWGFFLEILQRTEYAEGYVMDPLAERMLEADAGLRKAYERRIGEDPEFARDPDARLRFFYEKTPWFDARFKLYPVGLER